jgi:hypothetical protein
LTEGGGIDQIRLPIMTRETVRYYIWCFGTGMMEYTSIVLFRGAKAYYKVCSGNGKMYTAVLQRYDGGTEGPPKSITFYREGASSMGDSDSIDLINELLEKMKQDNPLEQVLNSLHSKQPE